MIAWCLAGLAWAQSPPVPPVRGDAYVPDPFADHAWSIASSQVVERAVGRATFAYAHRPVVARERDDPSNVVPLVEDLAALWITGGGAIGPVRLGLTVPIYVRTAVDRDAAALAGDPAVDLQVVALPHRVGRPGVVVLGRVTGPMGAWRQALGADGVTYEVAVALDGAVGPVWLGGQLGWRGVPDVGLAGSAWDDGLLARLGVGVDVHPRWAVAAEANGFVALLAGVDVYSAPVEGTLSARYLAKSGFEARLGVGLPLTAGVGVPLARVLAGVGWRFGKPDDAFDPVRW